MSTRPEGAVLNLVDEQAAHDLVRRLPDATLRPFAPALLAFFADLSAHVLSDRALARSYPDATAFGYWSRRSNVERLQQRFAALEDLQGGVRVPRGSSFHVAPGNVEALFAYSWATAALCGNTSVVKVSSRGTGLADAMVGAIHEVLADHRELDERWHFVSYPRKRTAVTEALTAAVDLRVFWGGDATVSDLRALPARPDSRTVAFPDRESVLLLATSHYEALDDGARDDVARRCADDIFSFGQAACSSPRYVAWVGEDPGVLSQDLYGRIAHHSERLADITPTEVMNKRTFLYELAARGGVGAVAWQQPQWLVVRTDAQDVRAVEHPALGTVVEAHCSDLDEVTKLLHRADQTITHVGFDTEELAAWVRRSPGPWPKRLRPAGQAVDFDARWDGMDLLAEFTSLTTID